MESGFHMPKKELAKKISDESGFSQEKTKAIMGRMFAAIVETLLTEGRIELRNFGVFEVKVRPPRKARNPRTGARVDVPARNVVTFKPGKEMEELIQNRDQADSRQAAGEDVFPPE